MIQQRLQEEEHGCHFLSPIINTRQDRHVRIT